MMITAAFVVVFALGVIAGRLTRFKPNDPARSTETSVPEQQTILVKRSRASFRNPGKTAVTKYDEYKTSRGLYAPVRPGKGNTADEKAMK